MKRHYFQVNQDLASRMLARKIGLKESKNGLWFCNETNTSESRRNLQSAYSTFKPVSLNEMTSSSVATAIGTGGRSRSQIGSLFGGTYKQKKNSKFPVEESNPVKFAGELVGQKPGDQVRGKEKAKKSGKNHPFKGRLVGST